MKKTLIALSACATLVLAGCGDDGDSDSEELSKKEFIEQADEICKESNEQIEKAEEGFADPENPTEDEIGEAVDAILVPELRSQLEDIRELEPPAEDEDQINEMLDHLDAGIDAIEEDWRTGLSDNEDFDQANEIARDYGFEECGEE